MRGQAGNQRSECKEHAGVKVLDNVTFTAKSGEILGIAGIAGSGQKELLEAIAGLQKLESGDMIFHNPKKDKPVTFFHKDLHRVKELAKEGAFRYENGETVDFTGKTDKEIKELVNAGKVLFKEDEIIDLKDKTPLQIRELGIRLSFVPEDRLGMGLVGNMDIVDNMMLRSYRKGNSVFLDRSKPGKLADEIIEELEVVTPSAHTPVRRLSGGNVQKVLVGREIASAPKVLMAAYPVRGLDINSSYTIYKSFKQAERKRRGGYFRRRRSRRAHRTVRSDSRHRFRQGYGRRRRQNRQQERNRSADGKNGIRRKRRRREGGCQ